MKRGDVRGRFSDAKETSSGSASRAMLTSEEHRDRRSREHHHAEGEEEESEGVVGFGSEETREDDCERNGHEQKISERRPEERRGA